MASEEGQIKNNNFFVFYGKRTLLEIQFVEFKFCGICKKRFPWN